jgi:RNA-directed DNA polymerase
MMDERGKSDSPVVPGKPPNKAEEPAAEAAEGRGLAKGNSRGRDTLRTPGRAGAFSALERVRHAAVRDRKQRFTALLHHVYDVEQLRTADHALKRGAAAGIDGETWGHYGEGLEEHLQDLAGRLQRGAYRAKPVRRAYIPKADGRLRPLGVPALEDKLVQRAVVAVLDAIYEVDFLGFSYGFRPGRSPHQALDALAVGITTKKVNWVLDADIRGFFDTLDPGWLVKFVEHRVADRRVVRLIQKWLTAEHREEAEQFLAELRERFAQFGLTLHPDKTRLIEFGRFAAATRGQRGAGKPETFNFLGFTHSCGKTRRGKFTVLRQTMRQRWQAKLQAVKAELRRRLHEPLSAVGAYLGSVVRGHVQYYGVPMNGPSIVAFRQAIGRLWRWALRRRSQSHHLSWERMRRYIDRWLPPARICHPYPLVRLGVVTQGKSRMR